MEQEVIVQTPNLYVFPGIDKMITSGRIINVICKIWKADPDLIGTQNREVHILRPRQVCMYMMERHLGISLASIGELMATGSDHKFDHATVLNAKRTVQNLRDTNKSFNEKCSKAEEFITGDIDLNSYKIADDNKEIIAKLMTTIAQSRKMLDELLDDPDETYVTEIEMLKAETLNLAHHLSKRIAAIRQKLWQRYDSDAIKTLGS